MTHLHFSPCPPKHRLIAHRGVSALAPENTLASFQLAAEQGVDWVEFDLRLTKDERLIIFHDDTLDRTTNGTGLVHLQTLSQLRGLDAGSWFDKTFKNQRIPEFNAILPRLLALDLKLNIELKIPDHASVTHKKALVRELCALLKNRWPSQAPLPLVSSFHWECIELLREQFSEIPVGFLQDDCTLEMIEMVSKLSNAALHCDYHSLSPEKIAKAKHYELPLLAYTVNSPQDAHRLLEAGVFALFCDNPLAILDSPLQASPAARPRSAC